MITGRYNVVPYDEHPVSRKNLYRDAIATNVGAREALRAAARALTKPMTVYDDQPMKALIVPVGAYGELQMVAAATCRRGHTMFHRKAATDRAQVILRRTGRMAMTCELAPYFKRDAQGNRPPTKRRRAR